MTFGKWRQQLRLMHAVRLLAEGAKVTHAALEAGYSTASAFICMFKKVLRFTAGCTLKLGLELPLRRGELLRLDDFLRYTWLERARQKNPA